MSRPRNLTTTTLLCSALAVSLVASACKSKTDRDANVSVRSDTSAAYGGTTPTDTLNNTSNISAARSDESVTPARRTRRATSQRRMTDQERQLYQQGQWDSSRVGQQIPATPTPRGDTGISAQQQVDTGIPVQKTPENIQRDTLYPDTVLPQPDTVQPDTTRPDTLPLEQRAYPAVTPTDEPQDTTLPNVTPQQQPQQQPEQPADVAVRGDTAKPAETPAPGPTADEPSDGQIVQLTLSANAADSSAGVLASVRTRNAQVHEFAHMMVQDHGAANVRLTELTRRLNIRPDSAFADYRTFMEDSREDSRELAQKAGAEFDRAYVDQEVEMHEKVLETLDRKLIPEADNAELKTLLQEARQTVQRHLERARELQTTLRQ